MTAKLCKKVQLGSIFKPNAWFWFTNSNITTAHSLSVGHWQFASRSVQSSRDNTGEDLRRTHYDDFHHYLRSIYSAMGLGDLYFT